MQSWNPDITAATGPKYLAIAEAIARDIDAGKLRAGDRLPPQRVLAEALGLDLTTVTRAYGEAQRLGFVEGSGRRGSFVRAKPSAVLSDRVQDAGETGMNAPPEDFGGSLATAFRDCTIALLSPEHGGLPFQYQRSGGAPSVRKAGADMLTARGIPCSEDSVLMAAGGQNALHAIFSAELNRGDRLAVAPYAYPGLLALARRFEIELVPVATDEDGMLPHALDEVCTAAEVRGVYLVPTNDNPTGITMPSDRRIAIAQIIRKHGLLLIEDDAYGFLPAQPLAPVASLAPTNAWYVASVSKVLAPGLRVAWLRAPDVAGAWRLAADMHETAIMAPPLNAAIVAEWLRTDDFTRLVGEVRDEAASRQALARDCLPPGTFRAMDCGYHLWLTVSDDLDVRHIADVLRQHGLSAIPGEAFAVDRAMTHAATLRVSIGGSLTRERLQRGLQLLSALVSPQAPRKASLI
jgi:DNA-binding transcriptional MocR family regulator